MKKSRKNHRIKSTQPGAELNVNDRKNLSKATASLKKGLEWFLWFSLVAITLGSLTYFGVQWRREIGDLKDENSQLQSKIDGLESNINELNQKSPELDLNEYITIEEWGLRMKDLSGPGTSYAYSEGLQDGVKSETIKVANNKIEKLLEVGENHCDDSVEGAKALYLASITRYSVSSNYNEPEFELKLGEKDGYAYFASISNGECVEVDEAFSSVEGEARAELYSTVKSLEL